MMPIRTDTAVTLNAMLNSWVAPLHSSLSHIHTIPVLAPTVSLLHSFLCIPGKHNLFTLPETNFHHECFKTIVGNIYSLNMDI